jgi:hypothetical protein
VTAGRNHEYLFDARNAASATGGLDTPAGDAAFDASLVDRFNANYANKQLWTGAPSDPTPATLFSGRFTYTRPGTAYIALRQILGKSNFTRALQQIQRDYRFSSITENQPETEFHAFMPNHSAACSARLDEFFTQWFDTAYPPGGGANRPQLTGPGLDVAGLLQRRRHLWLTNGNDPPVRSAAIDRYPAKHFKTETRGPRPGAASALPWRSSAVDRNRARSDLRPT